MVVLFLIQLGTLLTLSAVQWGRYALTKDFAFYGQAWWKIGHANIDPWSSIFSISAIRNNAELILWPLAVLEPIFRSLFTLLALQDLALVCTGFVAFTWINECLCQYEGESILVSRVRWLALAAILLDPWCYQTALFDVHTAAAASLFAIVTAHALWLGKRRRAIAAAVLLGACGTVGLLGLVGVSASSLMADRKRSRPVALLVGVSAVFVLVILSSAGYLGQQGRVSNLSYRYLDPAGGLHPPLVGIVEGTVTHLPQVLHLLWVRLPLAIAFLLPVGLLGALTRRGFPIVATIFLPAMLSSDSSFFRSQQAFQVWPALSIVLVATVECLARTTTASRPQHWRINNMIDRIVSFFIPGVWLALLPTMFLAVVVPALGYWIDVTPASASVLREAATSIPTDAEVIASQGIIGRFSEHRWVYPLINPDGIYPLHTNLVDFVFTPHQGIPSGITPLQTAQMARYAEHMRGAVVVLHSSGVTVVRWTPPKGISEIDIKAAQRSFESAGAIHV